MALPAAPHDPTAPMASAAARRPAPAAWAWALLLAAPLAVWFGLDGLAASGRTALAVFVMAIVAWSALHWPDTPVALSAALALVLTGAIPATQFYAAFGNPLIWLLLGAFVVGAVLQSSGLGERVALAAALGARSFSELCWRLTAVIAATAFVVPSTTGRAALLLPAFLALAALLRDRERERALALLFPTTILLSAGASLLGAGAHLVAVDFLQRQGLPAPGFAGWLLLGAPFAALSCALATWTLLRLFVAPATRSAPLALPAPPRTPLTAPQRATALITLVTVGLWAASGALGLAPALIAVAAALLITWERVTGVSLKAALKRVEWNLLLFLAAALVMGEALLSTGAATWLADAALDALSTDRTPLRVALVAAVALLSLLSHLVIVSRTARVAVLVPLIAAPLAASGVDPVTLAMTVVMGSGFCQTLAVSAKSVALFAKQEQPTYSDADLLRLSGALLPGMWLLLCLFALFVWPALH